MVTGGAGFVGSHLAERLVELGNNVVVYDVFNDFYGGKEKNLARLRSSEGFSLVRGDILDYERLSSSMRGMEILFHLAAQPGVRYSLLHPVLTNNINTAGTLNALEAVKENGVGKVVNASSSSVYGDQATLPIKETAEKTPISLYGASKLLAEHYCRIYQEAHGLDVVSLRYFTVYGPRQRPDMAFHKFVRQIHEGRPITIYGDGSQTRDFTYVDDIVEGTISSAEVEGVAGEVFNLGSGTRTVLNDVIGFLVEFLGSFDVSYEPKKKGDVTHTLADISKAREILGYNPRVSLKEGLRSFIRWFDEEKPVIHNSYLSM
jgi:UDP-glucose 4-epimerase